MARGTMNKTWGDFKRAMEAEGVTDDMVIEYIDVSVYSISDWHVTISLTADGQKTVSVDG